MRAKIRGTELYFDVDGMGLVPEDDRMVERPVVFLLHGGPGSDHSFFKSIVTAQLREVAQLVFIDHRGSGRSAAGPVNTYTLENNIDDVDALRDYLGLEKICVLGSSYGGMVAQGYAIRYPDRVSKLILSVTAPSFRFMEDAKQIVEERGTPEQKRVCERLWNGTFESIEQRHEFSTVMGPMYSTTFDPNKAAAAQRRGISSYEQLNLGFGDFLRTFDFIDELHTIPCPTLVVGGAHDWICPPNHARLIAEKIPNAQLKIFENSSHLVAIDEPDAYLATLREFLTSEPG